MLRQLSNLSNSTPHAALFAKKRFLATASAALSSVGQTHASSLSNWPGTSFSGGQVKNYIGGEFKESKANKWTDVHDPSTQTLLSRVPETTESEFEEAVGAAKKAFETWRKTSVLTRQSFVMECVVWVICCSGSWLLTTRSSQAAKADPWKCRRTCRIHCIGARKDLGG